MPIHEKLTGRQLVSRVIQCTGLEPDADTVDRFKAGDPDQVVTGVATTFIASMDILEQAVERGLNFILTHEPTFYTHRDELAGLETDAVVQAKLRYIEEHKLMVWRFHDLPHRIRPDMIVRGLLESMNWPEATWKNHAFPFTTVPPLPLKELALQLKQKTGASVLRVVGDWNQPCSRIAIRVGSPGDACLQNALRDPDVDVLITGECSEWIIGEYVRDANVQGRPVAVILLGHRNSEELGVAWISRWVASHVSEVPVVHLSVSDPFVTPNA